MSSLLSFRDQVEMTLQKNKKTLVIAAGDSWTFGDSLGTIEQNRLIDDFNARFTQVYGRLVADELDADWLNYGFCGGNNLSVITFLSNVLLGHHYRLLSQTNYNKIRHTAWPSTIQEVLDNEQEFTVIIKELKETHCKSNHRWTAFTKNYDRIIVLLTLTETGRDLNWHGKHCGVLAEYDSVTDYLKFEEAYLYDQIKTLKEKSNAEFFIGRNFSIDFDSTRNSLVKPKDIWIKLNFDEAQRQNFHIKNIALTDILLPGPVSGIGLHPLLDDKLIHLPDRKQYFTNQVDRADKLWQWLRNNPLHHNAATCHPKKEGHRIWADHFLNQII